MNVATRRRACGWLCLAVALVCCPATAHQRSTSTSQWQLAFADGRVTADVNIGIPWRGLQAALPELPQEGASWDKLPSATRELLRAYFLEHFVLTLGGQVCAAGAPPVPIAVLDDKHLGLGWQCTCSASDSAEAELRIDLFFHEDPSHLHLARLTLGSAPAVERIFMEGRARAQLGSAAAFSRAALAGDSARPAPAGESLFDFVSLGVQHIATGFDHMAFLLGLLVIGGSLLDVLRLVTGFTLAHSLTLAAGVLGWVHPAQSAVEALIGLSIAVVALENFSLTSGARTRRGILHLLTVSVLLSALAAASGRLAVPAVGLAGVGLFSICYLKLVGQLARPARLRWCVAFAFGLVHGFGFAGLLNGIGLPPGRVGIGLLGFNLGVELGQLVLVALVWPLLRWVVKPGVDRARDRLVVQLASLPTLVAGLYWFLTRLWA